MTTWTLRDGESGVTEECEGSLARARECAEEWARAGDYGDVESTVWTDVTILDEDGDEVETVTVAIDPDEPECCADRTHAWVDDGARGFGAVVTGHGGGVILRECCVHCGVRRVTNTWAQRPDTGEQGLTSVRYDEGDAPEPSCWDRHDEIEATDGATWRAEIGEVGDGEAWQARVVDSDGAVTSVQATDACYAFRARREGAWTWSEREEAQAAALRALRESVEDHEAALDREAEREGHRAGMALAKALEAAEAA